MQKVLFIDDKKEELEYYYSFLCEDYKIHLEQEAICFEENLIANQFDAIILDINNGLMNGFDLREKIIASKFYNKCPIIFKSSIANTENIEKGLDADCEFITPDMGASQIKLRIKKEINNNHIKRVGPIKLDTFLNKLTINDEPIDLTKKEFDILRLLLVSSKAVKKETIYDLLYSKEINVQITTLNTHIANLRKKLIPYCVSIKHKRMFGYRIDYLQS